MYTVRIREKTTNIPVEVVVDNRDLSSLLNILEDSRGVVAFQVWRAGLGQCRQADDFVSGGFTKFADEGLW